MISVRGKIWDVFTPISMINKHMRVCVNNYTYTHDFSFLNFNMSISSECIFNDGSPDKLEWTWNIARRFEDFIYNNDTRYRTLVNVAETRDLPLIVYEYRKESRP